MSHGKVLRTFSTILNLRSCATSSLFLKRSISSHINSNKHLSYNHIFKNTSRMSAALNMSKANLSTKVSEKKTLGSDQDSKMFHDIYPKFIQDLTDAKTDPHMADVNNWLKIVLDYNILDGKKNRSLALIHSYRQLMAPNVCSEENIERACILGWCLELLQAYFLIADDIMDESITRRGKPCWYRNAGLIALNDCFVMESCIFILLKKYFQDLPCYVSLIELFHKTIYQTTQGQCLDMLSNPTDKKADILTFTEERYKTIVKYKTAFYSFVLPVQLALHLSGCADRGVHQKAETVLLKIGEYFQIQDDYLDCFGDPLVIGKVGTDIEESKCCWLIVKALQLASDKQKAILVKNYGLKDPEAVSKIKQVYKELELSTIYHEYEETVYQEIVSLVLQLKQESSLPEEIFNAFLNKIYKRIK